MADQALPIPKYVRAFYDYTPRADQPSALAFKRGTIFQVARKSSKEDWWYGSSPECNAGKWGYIPVTHAPAPKYVRASRDYNPQPNQTTAIPVKKGSVLQVDSRRNSTGEWWYGFNPAGPGKTWGYIPVKNTQPSKYVRALKDYTPRQNQPTAIAFKKGAVFQVEQRKSSSGQWWYGYNPKYRDGCWGYLPVEHVEFMQDSNAWARL